MLGKYFFGKIAFLVVSSFSQKSSNVDVPKGPKYTKVRLLTFISTEVFESSQIPLQIQMLPQS